MVRFSCQMPARARKAIAVATAVARHFFGPDVAWDSVGEWVDGSRYVTGFDVVFTWATGRSRIGIGMRQFRSYGDSTCWGVVEVRVDEMVFKDGDLCALHDRISGGLPHFGLEYVRESEPEQLLLPGVEAEPAQGNLPLCRQPEPCYLFG